MNKINTALKNIKKTKKIGLMTHVVVGYPTLKTTRELIYLMAKSNVDMVELQIPFSDPLADGATIMQACEKALKNGTKVKDTFKLVRSLRSIEVPLLIMSYFNIVFRYGVERFFQDAAKVGISGLIVPDMPIDEEREEHFYSIAKKYNLYTIQVVSPATTEERFRKIKKYAEGFIYATAHQGITGVKDALHISLSEYLHFVRNNVNVPITVGFGISKKEHMNVLEGKADMAVVGSALLEVINKLDKENIFTVIKHFIRELRGERNI